MIFNYEYLINLINLLCSVVVARLGTRQMLMAKDQLVRAFGNISSTSALTTCTLCCLCRQLETRYGPDAATFPVGVLCSFVCACCVVVVVKLLSGRLSRIPYYVLYAALIGRSGTRGATRTLSEEYKK